MKRIMKRLFTLLLVATSFLAVKATDYTDKLQVLVNGEEIALQDATISINEHDGVYDLKLVNLSMGGGLIVVGDVALTDIVPQMAGSTVILQANKAITITSDNPQAIGPALGALPIEMVAAIEDGKLRTHITLNLTMLGQSIDVRFGEEMVTGRNYHIPNGNFEKWVAAKESLGNTYKEPVGWHSFASGTGALVALAGNHLEQSDKGRSGSCARIFSTSILGIVANGTMTTGRMNAGSMIAADKENNYAYTDMSLTELDKNGDPYYTPMTHKPDSLVMWIQFKQGTPNATYPWASVSVAITDGTRYQDPELDNTAYNNVVGKAQDTKIPTTNGSWRRLSIPFDYNYNNGAIAKLLQATISTNAEPGQGSDGDEVLIDDLTLVYNSKLKELNIDGFSPDKFEYESDDDIDTNSLVAVADGQDAIVGMSVENSGGDKLIKIAVCAADVMSSHTYTIRCKNATGIADVKAQPMPANTYYNINGQQVNSSKHGQISIVRLSDGRIVKTLTK